jgi:hypothetical protein
MPIIEDPGPSLPLSQGDILEGVPLFITKNVWPDDGEAARIPHRLCLVVSRPCIAQHERYILVSAIEQYKNKLPSKFEDFDEACEFFKDIRDGTSSPDQFYLGQLPGHDGTFCARLDSFHTVFVPAKGTDRDAFVTKRRVARLNSDFGRDLHLRVLRSFASLGFDDHGWQPTEDLKAAVMVGQRETKAAEVVVMDLRARLQSGKAQGFSHPTDKAKLEKDLEKAERDMGKLQEALAPFEAELEKREKQ